MNARQPRAALALLCVVSGAACAADDDLPKLVSAAAPTASIGGPGGQITASNGDANVSIKLSYQSSAIPSPIDSGIVRNGAAFTTMSLTASAPIDKGEQSQTLFANGGMGKANSIGITFFHFLSDWRNPTAAEKTTFDQLCDGMQQKAESNKGVKHEDALKLDCSKPNFLKYDPDSLPAIEKVRPGPMPGGWGLGVTGKVGQNESTYYDPTSLTKSSTQSKPWSVGVVASYLFPTNEALVSIGLDRRRAYKDQPISTRCPASTTTAPVECFTGSFGAPSVKSSSVVTIEGRTTLPRDMALSIAVARDTTKKVTAVEIPLYLTANAAGALTGGIKATWDTDKKKTTLGVFVGVPFDVWK